MITNAQYAITDTPTKVADTNVGHRTVHLAPVGNTTVYLGGTSGVSSSNGYGLNKSLGEHNIVVGSADEVWAVCASGQTETLTVLISEY